MLCYGGKEDYKLQFMKKLYFKSDGMEDMEFMVIVFSQEL